MDLSNGAASDVTHATLGDEHEELEEAAGASGGAATANEITSQGLVDEVALDAEDGDPCDPVSQVKFLEFH